VRLQVSAKADYAIRALVALASRPEGESAKTAEIAREQAIPVKFLENILVQLRRKRLVTSMRGPTGGFRIGRPAGDITIAEVLEAVEGPLVDVHGFEPDHAEYPPSVAPLRQLWVAAETGVRDLFTAVTVEDILTGDFLDRSLAQTSQP